MIPHLIIAGLAGGRLASMLNWEEGPGLIFLRVRRLAGVPATGEITGALAKAIVCPWCLTVWTTSAMLILGALVSWWIPAVPAAWAIAMFAHRWVGSDP